MFSSSCYQQKPESMKVQHLNVAGSVHCPQSILSLSNNQIISFLFTSFTPNYIPFIYLLYSLSLHMKRKGFVLVHEVERDINIKFTS